MFSWKLTLAFSLLSINSIRVQFYYNAIKGSLYKEKLAGALTNETDTVVLIDDL